MKVLTSRKPFGGSVTHVLEYQDHGLLKAWVSESLITGFFWAKVCLPKVYHVEQGPARDTLGEALEDAKHLLEGGTFRHATC